MKNVACGSPEARERRTKADVSAVAQGVRSPRLEYRVSSHGRRNEGGWIGATAQRKSRCKTQELKPRGLVLEFGGFAFVTEPIPHRELQLVGASLQ